MPCRPESPACSRRCPWSSSSLARSPCAPTRPARARISRASSGRRISSTSGPSASKDVGDGSDKLVTVGANPAHEGYGKVVSSVSVGGRHEAHHGGPTDDRRHLWVGGLDDSQIFIFDVASDPARPKLARTLTDFPQKTGGVVGPHGFYALPGRMLISALSNRRMEAGGRRWSSTTTTASSSARSGCRTMLRTATTRASSPSSIACSRRPSAARTTTCASSPS